MTGVQTCALPIFAIDDKGGYSHNQGRSEGRDSALQAVASEAALVAGVQQALARQPDLPVLLAADKNLPYQQVMSLMGRLREAGVQRIALSVK